MRFDVVSWVKDGAEYLPVTLKRLDEVLPSEFVHRKIAVDDHSQDDTVDVLEDFGWEVYDNPSSGISAGANYALSKVDCPYFMSFEQDLLLSEEWFTEVARQVMDGGCDVASGVRFADRPKSVADLQHYVYDKYLLGERLSPYLSNREASVITLGKTLDNTFYRTRVIRGVDGFPFMDANSGLDTVLAYVLHGMGYKWRVNPCCVSVHLRKGLWQELRHQRWYAVASVESKRRIERLDLDVKCVGQFLTFPHGFSRLVLSPFSGFLVALKMRNPFIVFVHPLIKFSWFMGYLDSLRR